MTSLLNGQVAYKPATLGHLPSLASASRDILSSHSAPPMVVDVWNLGALRKTFAITIRQVSKSHGAFVEELELAVVDR